MLVLIQRVTEGTVQIDNKIYSEIGHGYVILLGVFETDTDETIDLLIPKIVNLRIMSDEDAKMNKSILDTNGEILVVSQFTLAADCRSGRRPSFIHAKEPEEAERMYDRFVKKLTETGVKVKTGQFGAMMQVKIVNDGPVTILLDSKTL